MYFIANVDNYKVVFKALELACNTIKSADVNTNSDFGLRVLSHKIHGTLVGFYLIEAEKQLKEKNIVNN